MFSSYVLKSVLHQKYYTGHTDNPQRRLKDHNNGRSIYTRRYKPWNIVFLEEFQTQQEAVLREKYLKSAAGRRWLKKKFKGK